MAEKFRQTVRAQTALAKIGLIAAVFVVVLALGMFLLNRFIDWSEREIELAQPQIVEFPPGTPLRTLSSSLGEKGVVDHPRRFELWVRLFEDYSKFQAGTYRFERAISPNQAAKAFLEGKSYITFALEITIPEGYTYRLAAQKLAAKGVAAEEEFSTLFQDAELLRALNIPSPTLEGFVYPATYRFPTMPTARQFIEEAVKTFWEKLPRNYEENVGYLGLSLKDAVTFASLIEAETPFAEEKPLVAEVIWNRLKSKAPLAIDASLIYGIEDYQGDIKRKHLSDASNQYNTRLHPGLPPTPICSPSQISLQAVLTPSKNGYLYYVLDTATGRHHFSRTAEEHSAYVRRLVNRK